MTQTHRQAICELLKGHRHLQRQEIAKNPHPTQGDDRKLTSLRRNEAARPHRAISDEHRSAGNYLGGKEAHPLSAGEDEAIITGTKDGKHQLTQPQLRSPVRRAIDGKYIGDEEEGQKNHPTPR